MTQKDAENPQIYVHGDNLMMNLMIWSGVVSLLSVARQLLNAFKIHNDVDNEINWYRLQIIIQVYSEQTQVTVWVVKYLSLVSWETVFQENWIIILQSKLHRGVN